MFKIASLYINGFENPFCLEAPFIFSWTFEQETSLKQHSYRIVVSSTSDNNGDYWDSKEITSNAQTNIVYGGREIPSRHDVFVKLIVKNEKGEVAEATSRFETTLKDEEWKGKWVSIPNNFNGGTLFFRKELNIDLNKKVKKARAYIIGLGYHEFYVNTKKIGKALLAPGLTDYNQTMFYKAYDFTDALSDKEINIIGVEVGYGWFGHRKMLAQFYIEYEDGTELEDHSTCCCGWWASGSPTIENSIYGGETYDARLEKLTAPNWTSREFTPAWDNGWMYMILTQEEKGKKVLQQIPDIEHLGDFCGVIYKKFSKNDIVYDFKQNLAGWVRIKVKGQEGTSITFKYAEGVTKDGHANQLNLRSAKCIDKYILKGEGIEEWSPRFTYHGFQYVEAIIDGEAEILEIVGEHIHTNLRQTGFFKCSDAIINQLHHMSKITEENNDHSIFTDCPQRDERFGWLNDLSARVFQQTFNFDCLNMYRKVSEDINHTMNEEGAIADTAPYYTGGQPADTTTVSYLLVPYYAYIIYGDVELLKSQYPNCKRWVEYLLTRQKGYIMDYYYYADWVNPDQLADSFSDSICISTMFLNWHLKVLAAMARIAGHKEDAEKYAKMAQESDKAINEKYYHEEGYYSKNTQAENAMAVSLGICLEENKEKVVKSIVDNIIKNNYHLTCGNQGYRHVFYLLCEYGYVDLALQVLRNPEYPGWGFMVKNGATTVWERWELEMFNIMDSFDHPMFGSYDAMFYRYLGGINLDKLYDNEITIHPRLAKTLDHVECSFDSIKGRITSNWRRENGIVELDIVIPSNTKANLIFDYDSVEINGKVSPSHINVESGTYRIKIREE